MKKTSTLDIIVRAAIVAILAGILVTAHVYGII
jgi:hypothetical protein